MGEREREETKSSGMRRQGIIDNVSCGGFPGVGESSEWGWPRESDPHLGRTAEDVPYTGTNGQPDPSCQVLTETVVPASMLFFGERIQLLDYRQRTDSGKWKDEWDVFVKFGTTTGWADLEHVAAMSPGILQKFVRKNARYHTVEDDNNDVWSIPWYKFAGRVQHHLMNPMDTAGLTPATMLFRDFHPTTPPGECNLRTCGKHADQVCTSESDCLTAKSPRAQEIEDVYGVEAKFACFERDPRNSKHRELCRSFREDQKFLAQTRDASEADCINKTIRIGPSKPLTREPRCSVNHLEWDEESECENAPGWCSVENRESFASTEEVCIAASFCTLDICGDNGDECCKNKEECEDPVQGGGVWKPGVWLEARWLDPAVTTIIGPGDCIFVDKHGRWNIDY
jgi:hypothetical protein